MSGNIKIYVDGDACPVKQEVLRVAERHGLEVFMVSNQGLRQGLGKHVHNIVVPHGPDAADDWIAEHITEGDIAITSDIPLASRCLEKKAVALKPNGDAFTENNIGTALAMRELNQHLRETGAIAGHHASFSKRDRSQFLQSLEQMIQQLKRR